MKRLIILLLVLTIVGCSQQDAGRNTILKVYEQIDDTTYYGLINETTDELAIQDIKNILSNGDWVTNKIKALNKEPDYQLSFEDTNSEMKNNNYDVWISSDRKSLDIINREDDNYIHITKDDAMLFLNILTGEKP